MAGAKKPVGGGQDKDKDALPAKEQALFRSIVKFYDTKQYKKGVKAADAVLKKFPNHAETIAMKGLVLSGLDKREEAHTLAKQALRTNVGSTVAWHVYGLLHRADHNYEEAIKCYKNALRLDPGGQPQVQRDLAQLQAHTREWGGYAETRNALLTARATAQHNWTAMAVGYAMSGEPGMAVAVLDQWAGVAAGEGGEGGGGGGGAGAPAAAAAATPAQTAAAAQAAQAAAYERSECALYAASIQAGAGEAGAALARLDALLAADPPGVKDVRGAKAQRAACLAALGRAEEAGAAWRELLDGRPADLSTHDGLRAARGLPACGHATRVSCAPGSDGAEAARSGLRSLYADLITAHPAVPALRRCVLDFEPAGDGFRAVADAYARFLLERGAPSLFSDLAPLYPGGGGGEAGDAAKAADLGALFAAYEAGLREAGALPPPPPPPAKGVAAAGPAGTPLPPPSRPAPVRVQLAGACLALGQHAARLGRTGEALAALDRAEAALGRDGDAGTRADVLSARSRVLGAAGDAAGAAAAATAAAALDPSDRYLNSLAAQALFAAGEPAKASATAARFARDAEASGAGGLSEMQCMWFELASGRAAAAAGRAGPALKAFTSTLKHFDTFDEDAFDFHGYCVRKCTLRAYADLLRTGPVLRSEGAFAAAAIGAVRVYLALDDERRAADAAASAAAAAAAAADADEGLSAEERKRARQRAKKEAARAEKAAAAARAAAAAAAEAERAEAAAAAAAAAAAKPGGGKRAGSARAAAAKKDADPDGAALAATPDPLDEAAKLTPLLAAHAPALPDTHALVFEVASRRGKPLLMVRAARAAAAELGAGHHAARALALRAVVECPRLLGDATHPALRAVVEGGLSELRGSVAGPEAMHASAVAAARDMRDAPALAAAATSSVDVLGADGPTAASDLVATLPDPDPAADAAGAHGAAVEVERLLSRLEGGSNGGPATAAWRSRCAAVFEWSAHFGGAKRVALPEGEAGVAAAANGVAALAV